MVFYHFYSLFSSICSKDFFIFYMNTAITKPKQNNLITKPKYYFHWNQLQNTHKKVSTFNFSISFFSNGLCHLDLVIFFLRQQQTKTFFLQNSMTIHIFWATPNRSLDLWLLPPFGLIRVFYSTKLFIMRKKRI